MPNDKFGSDDSHIEQGLITVTSKKKKPKKTAILEAAKRVRVTLAEMEKGRTRFRRLGAPGTARTNGWFG